MSIGGALFASVAGLSAQSQAIGMISDNIANVNTVGYKGLNASFSTLVTTPATANSHSPGGVRSQPIQSIDSQGILQTTTSSTDIAISGNGLFVVNEAAAPGPGDEYLYTRAGSFRTDSSGNLVNDAGYFLQGWPLSSSGALPANPTVLSSVQTVNVANLAGIATATGNIDLGINLPATAINGETHSATVQILDSLGTAHDLQIDFVYDSATPEWDITVQNPTLSSTGAASGTVAAAARSISFDGNGTPAVITFPAIDITWTATTANPSSIAANLGTVGLTDGVTQFSGPFVVSFLDQDGLPFGSFTDVIIDEDGIVSALFDNGRTLAIYQLPLARFGNPNGLSARDGNAFIETLSSGNVLLQQANTGGAGVVASAALENSNVDLAEEFTNLIVAQRAFSANTRVITTADELLEEITSVIR